MRYTLCICICVRLTLLTGVRSVQNKQINLFVCPDRTQSAEMSDT